MGAYTTYDFSESINRVGVQVQSIEKVLAAWGNGGPTEWEGGFIFQTRDGRYAYVWGWNDYSGWGCQDGAHIEWYDTEPDRVILRGTPQHLGGYIAALSGDTSAWQYEWDENPEDLNKYVRGEVTVWE